MKTVKLTTPLLIGDRHYEAGEVVLVTDDRAHEMLKGGHAEEHDGQGEVANADSASPLAEAITPHPPGGAVFDPADALSPNIADNPGLVALAAASGKKPRSRKARPAAGEATPEAPAEGEDPGPDATANELE